MATKFIDRKLVQQVIKIYQGFDTDGKKNARTVLVFVSSLAIFEAAGVFSILPFLAILGNDALKEEVRKFLPSILSSSDERLTIFLCFFSIASVVITTIFRVITQIKVNLFIENTRVTVGQSLFENYLSRKYEFFADQNSANLVKNVLSEVDAFTQQVFRPLVNLISSSLVIICITTLIIVINFKVAISVLAGFSIIYFVIYRTLKKYFEKFGAQRNNANIQRYKSATEAFGAIKSIKLYGQIELYVQDFLKHAKSYSMSQAYFQVLNQLPVFIIEVIIFTVVILSILFLALLNDDFSTNLAIFLPTLGVFAFSAYRLRTSIHHIYNGVASLSFGNQIIENVFNEAKTEKIHQKKFRTNQKKNEIIQRGKPLVINSVSYSYPSSERVILDNISIQIEIGKHLGIAGKTGSGKSTLLDILLGLLSPDRGSISVGDLKLNDKNIHNWQSELGYVPQDIYLLDSSIASNIAFGLTNFEDKLDLIKRCAKIAQIHEFIETQLPDGYETIIGERGSKISGGQKQRIGIARALFNSPKILILDEATSALDKVTEKKILNSLFSNKNLVETIIIVSHYSKNFEDCDNIVVLDKGQLIASGSQTELKLANKSFL